jgi:hypothetical protein
LSITLVLCVQACSQQRVVVTTPYDLSLQSVTNVSVHTSGGDVTVEPGAAGALHVDAERVALSESGARALAVTVALSDDGQSARVDWVGTPDHQHVSFTVRMPPELPLDVDAGLGSVSVSGVTGGIVAHTGGGDVTIANAKGAVDARADRGDINVRSYSGTATLKTGLGSILCDGTLTGQNVLQTVNGFIAATLPAASRLVVSARTDLGRTSNEFGLPVADQRTSSQFAGRLGDGDSGSLTLTTGLGDVVLHREP